MSRFLGWGSIVGLALSMPTMVNGQNVLPFNPTEGTPQEYYQLRRFSAVVGKLSHSDQGSGIMTLEIQYQVPVVQNPQQMQQLVMQMQPMSRRPMGMMCCCGGKMGYLPMSVTSTITWTTVSKKFSLEPLESLVVRRASLPVEYDDNGKMKKYSQSEIKRLKGSDRSKPGYSAKPEDLQAGQYVTIYPAQAKAVKSENNAGNNDLRIPVRMIFIMADANVPAVTDNRRK